MNKKTKKQYLLIGLILFTIIYILFVFYRQKELPIFVTNQQNHNEVKIETEKEVLINNESIKKSKSYTLETKTIKVSLIVSDNKYNTEIKENTSVFEAMKQIENESGINNSFSFKYIDNASLGSFITEINGIKGIPGKYWIYYINGKLASVGVSNQVLKEGDIINWNQEGI
ncbi:MAG: DUF4430 domain-containing protein [Candidatus Nomurabacteria bacterium]|nr:DUF4430 domain-containing protein [Candidatus Nomurabacteria bacterium]